MVGRKIDETKTNNAVVCIMENNKGQILLLRRNFAPYGWCLPGGKYDPITESATAAIRREIREETGIMDLWALDFVKNDVSVNGINISVFKAKCDPRSVNLSKEHSAYIWIDKVLPELPLAGRTLSFLSNYTFEGEKANANTTIPFGKYKGQMLVNVIASDPEYVLWLDRSTSFKINVLDLNQAQRVIEDNRRQQEQQEWDEIRRKSEEEYRTENLARAVDTPFGKAIDNHDGDYTLIDDSGNSTHELVHWYYGWEKGSWSDDI